MNRHLRNSSGTVQSQPIQPPEDRDMSSNSSGGASDAPPASPPSPETQRRETIEDRIADMQRVSLAAPSLCLMEGDTLVFVAAPPKDSDQSDFTYNRIEQHFRKPIRMHRESIDGLASESLKSRMKPFPQRPSLQNAILRKHGYPAMPEGVKYVLDLTPSSEGNEAAAQLAQLSCPKGVLLWYQSRSRWEIADRLVGGRDEFTQANVDPPLRDYTALRHRLAIQRVLIAAANEDPTLDSAPKVYTYAGVARMLGVNGHAFGGRLVMNHVLMWMRADPNGRFVEALPEAALRIAHGVQSEVLACDAFAVLVGEAALDMVCEPPPNFDTGDSSSMATLYRATQMTRAPAFLTDPGRRSTHGRAKTDIWDEDWALRLSHARVSFREHVENAFATLAAPNMAWIENLECVLTLVAETRTVPNSDDVCKAREDFIDALKAFVHGSIHHLLCSEYNDMYKPFTFDKAGGDALYPRTAPKHVWDQLGPEARIFTRAFWQLVEGWSIRIDDFEREGSTNHEVVIEAKAYPHYPGLVKTDRSAVSPVECSTLRELLDRLGNTLQAQGWKGKKPLTLPFRPAGPTTWSRDGTGWRDWDMSSTSSGSVLHGAQTTVHGSLFYTRPIVKPEPVDLDDTPSEDPSDPWWNDPIEEPSSSMATAATTIAAPPAQTLAPVPAPALAAAASPLPAPRRPIFLSRTPFFQTFLQEVTQHLEAVAGAMLAGPAPQGSQIGSAVDIFLTPTLLCLGQAETDKLPLWAGGLDDGTHGAYGDHVPEVPDAVQGFGPGSIRAALTVDGGFEMVSAAGGSTVNSSMGVHDGYSEYMDRRRVYGAESVAASSTADSATLVEDDESFVDVDADGPDGTRTPTGAEALMLDAEQAAANERDSADERDSLARLGISDDFGTFADDDEDDDGDADETMQADGDDDEGGGVAVEDDSELGDGELDGDALDASVIDLRRAAAEARLRDTVGLDANTVYVYKDGKDEDEDLMTRL